MDDLSPRTTPPDPVLLRAFRFQVKLLRSVDATEGANETPDSSATPTGTPLGDGAFQECSGLEIEMDVQEYLEGGRNDGVIRRVGRAKYQNLVLKRGMFVAGDGTANRQLWDWLQGIVSGQRPVVRYDGIVEVMNLPDQVLATWVFDRGLPAKVSGPQLNGHTGEIAIEELHIAHEGLRMVAP
ncbi:MAG: phage tail protein [Thermoplasmata archaeon]|nr:phage tail protein [Thermoplasmata archaeon]